MFKNLIRHFGKKRPEFNSLKNFEYKDQYFYRVAAWDWLTETEIHIYDPHGPRLITLDEWPQIVFLDARGKLTVAEYVDYMAELYTSKIPEELDDTIIYQLNSLHRLRIIEYSDTEKELETKFEEPIRSWMKL